MSLHCCLCNVIVFHFYTQTFLSQDELHSQYTQASAKHSFHLSTLQKETQQEYDLIIEKSLSTRTNKYAQIIKHFSTQYGKKNHTGLFNQDALLMSQKYLSSCGDKSLHIAALAMAMSHLNGESGVVLHMSALYLMLESKQKQEIKIVAEYCGSLSADDLKFVQGWTQKTIKNNWNFNDLRKYETLITVFPIYHSPTRYLTQTCITELRDHNKNAHGFKNNITLYTL